MKMGKLNVGQIARVVGALGYFISPVDAVPDLIPVVGYGDVAVVMTRTGEKGAKNNATAFSQTIITASNDMQERQTQ